MTHDLARGPSILAVGFGTTVAMWGVGYLSRLPLVQLPGPVLLPLLLLCLLAGGVALGRLAGLGWRHGAIAGALSGLLNLLVLGGLLMDDGAGRALPSAAIWLPGSILVASLLAGAGAAMGRSSGPPAVRNWSAALVGVAIGAALLLLGVGGLVTSTETGLAVVDWPNTFGYNMFLYPLSRMTGGIYYEHAHRLFGALVGLTTLVLALQVQRSESRRWVRRFGWALFATVVVQGILGGLRVTGTFTLAADEAVMRPSLALAMVHGILGQLFFGGLVALGAFTSTGWREGAPPRPQVGFESDRLLGALLLGSLLLQLLLGAAQRHFQALLLVHATVGVAVVTPLALHVGIRAWGKNPDRAGLRRLGIALIVAIGGQILLGIAAWVATGLGDSSVGAAVPLATAHQWFGAVVLGLAVLVFCWHLRTTGPQVEADPGERRDSAYT